MRSVCRALHKKMAARDPVACFSPPGFQVAIFLSRFSFASHKEGQNRGTTRSLGIWRILKYYELLLLQNTMYRLCYYLFTMEAEKFSVTHKRPLLIFTVKKNTVCIRNNFFLLQWKKKWLTGFCETSTNRWRHTTWTISMKVISNHSFCVTAAAKGNFKLR